MDRFLRLSLCASLGLTACRTAERVPLPDTSLARSADGHVAFVRATPGRLVQTSLGDEQATELWIADADGGHPRRLVTGAANDSVERALAGFTSPRFSPDGHVLYFLSSAWVTSSAVHAVDIATGHEWFIAGGNSLDVIPAGPYAGCLLVAQHRYRANEGSYDWTWVLDTRGKTLVVAARDSDDTDRQIAKWKSGVVPDSPGKTPSPAPCN